MNYKKKKQEASKLSEDFKNAELESEKVEREYKLVTDKVVEVENDDVRKISEINVIDLRVKGKTAAKKKKHNKRHQISVEEILIKEKTLLLQFFQSMQDGSDKRNK